MEEFLEDWKAEREQEIMELQWDYNHTGSSKQMKEIKEKIKKIKFWLKPENIVKVGLVWQAAQVSPPVNRGNFNYTALAPPQIDPELFDVVKVGMANNLVAAETQLSTIKAERKQIGNALGKLNRNSENAMLLQQQLAATKQPLHNAGERVKQLRQRQPALVGNGGGGPPPPPPPAALPPPPPVAQPPPPPVAQPPVALPGGGPAAQPAVEGNNMRGFANFSQGQNWNLMPPRAPQRPASFWNKTKKFFKNAGKQISRSFKYDKNTKARLYLLNAQIEQARRAGQSIANLERQKRNLKGETWNRKIKVGINTRYRNFTTRASRLPAIVRTAVESKYNNIKSFMTTNAPREATILHLKNQRAKLMLDINLLQASKTRSVVNTARASLQNYKRLIIQLIDLQIRLLEIANDPLSPWVVRFIPFLIGYVLYLNSPLAAAFIIGGGGIYLANKIRYTIMGFINGDYRTIKENIIDMPHKFAELAGRGITMVQQEGTRLIGKARENLEELQRYIMEQIASVPEKVVAAGAAGARAAGQAAGRGLEVAGQVALRPLEGGPFVALARAGRNAFEPIL